MRLRLLAGLLLLASLSSAGIHTFPPSGTGGLLGSGGPKQDELLVSSLLTDLVAYWSFDGASTTFAADDPSYYGYDSHATFDFSKQNSGPVSTTTAKLGGRAVQVSPNADNAFTISTTAFRMTGGFSVCMWHRCTGGTCSTNPQNILFAASTAVGSLASPDYDITLAFSPLTTGVAHDSTSGDSAANFGSETTTYKHICAIYTSSDKILRTYVDGVLSQTGAALTNGLKQTSTVVTSVHANDISGGSGEPIIDELYVASRAITITEIGCLYGSGTPPPYPFTGVCL